MVEVRGIDNTLGGRISVGPTQVIASAITEIDG